MSWSSHLLAVLALAVACGLWVLLQRWIAKKDPQLPGVDRRCSDCTCDREDGEAPIGPCHKTKPPK